MSWVKRRYREPLKSLIYLQLLVTGLTHEELGGSSLLWVSHGWGRQARAVGFEAGVMVELVEIVVKVPHLGETTRMKREYGREFHLWRDVLTRSHIEQVHRLTPTSVKTLFSLLQYVASYSLDHCHCLVSFCHLMCSAFAYENVHLVNNFALFGVGPVLLPPLPVAGGHLHLKRIKIVGENLSDNVTFSCCCSKKF